MSKKSELKENVLAAKVEKALSWILDYKVPVLAFLGVLIFGLLVGSVFILRRNEKRELVWARLSQAQSLLAINQLSQARQILTETRTESPDLTTLLFSSYYMGQVELADEKFEDALPLFEEVVEKGGKALITPLALSNLGYTQERLGNFSEASQTYQQFMDQYGEHFMAPRVQLSLGRSLLKAGEMENGKIALDQLVDLYPTSPWAENARQILDKSESR
ncbi:hypothetical protein BVX98_02070 [bacterium F11]|nr:hypothetical protein BVX98_02070 [bacterium F11]